MKGKVFRVGFDPGSQSGSSAKNQYGIAFENGEFVMCTDIVRIAMGKNISFADIVGKEIDVSVVEEEKDSISVCAGFPESMLESEEKNEILDPFEIITIDDDGDGHFRLGYVEEWGSKGYKGFYYKRAARFVELICCDSNEDFLDLFGEEAMYSEEFFTLGEAIEFVLGGIYKGERDIGSITKDIVGSINQEKIRVFDKYYHATREAYSKNMPVLSFRIKEFVERSLANKDQQKTQSAKSDAEKGNDHIEVFSVANPNASARESRNLYLGYIEPSGEHYLAAFYENPVSELDIVSMESDLLTLEKYVDKGDVVRKTFDVKFEALEWLYGNIYKGDSSNIPYRIEGRVREALHNLDSCDGFYSYSDAAQSIGENEMIKAFRLKVRDEENDHSQEKFDEVRSVMEDIFSDVDRGKISYREALEQMEEEGI